MMMKVREFIESLQSEEISRERKQELNPLRREVQSRLGSGEPIRLNFICTHNSRRSQLAQIWAHTFARHLGLSGITTLSGGTEAAAVHPNTIKTLERSGFDVEKSGLDNNPIYLFWSEPDTPPIECFSKLYNDYRNLPEEKFIAVMTCARAADDCPFIPDAEKRFTVTYDDPGASDGSDRENETYDACNRQIAREMLYVLVCE